MFRSLCVAFVLCALPALAQPYSGPPDGAAYWTVPAFKEFPIKGPQAAAGVVLWSHGVDGRRPQYNSTPAPLMRRFARAGWDVIKVQRNPSHERGWIPSGIRHSDDLAARADQAKADGYRSVIAAGRSYGGAISIEASGRTATIDAVIALAPGHGSDALGTGGARRFDSLTDQLIGAIAKVKAPRLLVMIAENDVYHPFEVRGPKLRAALATRAQPFILFDETMPLKGHGSGTTLQFDQWYGACIQTFITGRQPRAGETICEGPLMSGEFALPRDIKVAATGPNLPRGAAEMAGEWTGQLDKLRPVKIIFEELDASRVRFIYALGPEGMLPPIYHRRNGHWEGSNVVSRNTTGQFSISLTPPNAAGVAVIRVTGDKGKVWTGELRRGL